MGSLHADRASRGKEVLGAGDVARSLTRIAYEIVERNGGSDNLIIAGIPTGFVTFPPAMPISPSSIQRCSAMIWPVSLCAPPRKH